MRLLFFLLWAVCTAFAGNVTVPFTSVVSMDNPAMDNSVDPTPTYPLDARINRPGIHEVPAKPTLQVVIDKKWSNVGQWCKDPLGDEVRNALYKLCPEKYFKGWSPCKTGAKDYYSVKGIEYAWDDRHWDNGWINIRVTGAHFPDGMATDLRLALIDTAAAFVQSQPDIEKNCKWTRLEDGSAFKTKSHHFCFVSSSFEVATVMGNNAYIKVTIESGNDKNAPYDDIAFDCKNSIDSVQTAITSKFSHFSDFNKTYGVEAKIQAWCTGNEVEVGIADMGIDANGLVANGTLTEDAVSDVGVMDGGAMEHVSSSA